MGFSVGLSAIDRSSISTEQTAMGNLQVGERLLADALLFLSQTV